MTVEVKISRTDGQPEDMVTKVSVVSRDGEGNSAGNGEPTEIRNGEQFTFHVHDTQELRVYEVPRLLSAQGG